MREEPARLSEGVSVQARGRGNPTINLSDGHDFSTSYVGPEYLRFALEQNQAEALSLASADFDEDGVPDLVSGYSYNGQGIVTLLRGNVDSIYPNAPEAQQRRAAGTFTDAPFLSPAGVFAAPVAADFVGVGDFDGDSHWDVVAASRARGSLFLFSGDGHGGFAAAEEIVLPGTVTAMTTGEINRADGLTDIVVGVTGPSGSKVLVFEGPNGALKAQPEALPMPDTVTALAVGQLDDGYEMDLAVGADVQLVVVSGRDRKLSLDDEQQQRVLPARSETRAVGSAIKSLVIGDFANDHQPALALLTGDGPVEVITANLEQSGKDGRATRLSSWQERSLSATPLVHANSLVRAKMSSGPGDDLLVLDGVGNQLRLLSNTTKGDVTQTTLAASNVPVAAIPMRLNGDALTDLVFLKAGQSAAGVIHTEASQTFVVNSTADTNDGACTTTVNGCTLREAINAANSNPGADTINFNISGAAPYTINILSALPQISSEIVAIDGTSQPGFSGPPIIELNGANAGAANGLSIKAGNSSVRGLIINRFGGHGILLQTNGSNRIEGNYVGTNAAGSAALPVGFTGVQIDHSPNNTVGGTSSGAHNLISGSSPNIMIESANGNIVQGNYVGTDAAGNAALGGNGIFIFAGASNNLVGGTSAGARNVLSGNRFAGVDITSKYGVAGATGNIVQGNYIGTIAAGTAALGNNGDGVALSGVSGNIIGGTQVGAGNLLSGSIVGNGIRIFSVKPDQQAQPIASTDNLAQGNFIGTNAAGTAALPNHGAGININSSSHNAIGGTLRAARNTISGNSGVGINISDNPFDADPTGSTENLVQGNYIGTDVNGTTAIANGKHGIVVFKSSNNIIGGLKPEARNIIASSGGNGGGSGIVLHSANDNAVQGNHIGTDVTGMVAMGNSGPGVLILNSNRSTIGGEVNGARNLISSNNGAGITLYAGPTDPPVAQGGEDNKIQGNFIGTNATGTAPLGNASAGIQITITVGGANNTVGGPQPGMRNIISGNNGNGISIGIRLPPLIGADGNPISTPGTGGTGITVQNNYVGTDLTGQNCIGNALDGIFVDADSAINTISDNLVTCNRRNGVFIPQNSNPGVRIFIDNNSIFANSALGIDLGTAGITANDALDTDVGANLQQNFPVLTSFGAAAVDSPGKPIDPGIEAITITATLNSTPNTAFTVHWYFSSDAQCVTNQQGNRPLVTGKVPGVTTDGNGNAAFNFPFDFPAAITNGIINCTATDPQGNTSEFSACLPIAAATPTPTPLTVRFTSSTASVTETLNATTKVDLTVTRLGSTAAAATVNYATADGTASERSDYMAGLGTLRFAAGETSKMVSVFIVDDRLGENAETFSVTLSNPVGLALGSPAAVTVTINSNESVNGGNPVKDATFDTDFFVRIQYLDFFNREADPGGLNFWKNQIDECTTQSCREVRRINVSAAFFVSIEFQETGYLVYKTNQAAYNAGEFLRLRDFLPDLQEIGRGVIIGQPGWESQIEANKTKFFQDFVQRAKFLEAGNYPTTLTAAQFVDKLNANTYDPRNTGSGAALTQSQRNQLVSQLSPNPASVTLRAQTLRSVSENALFSSRQFNKAFVLMQYFGYLRRNPNDPPEAALDFGGYNFWLGKLNEFNGNYIAAEMVRAFITSSEYEQRFGP